MCQMSAFSICQQTPVIGPRNFYPLSKPCVEDILAELQGQLTEQLNQFHGAVKLFHLGKIGSFSHEHVGDITKSQDKNMYH